MTLPHGNPGHVSAHGAEAAAGPRAAVTQLLARAQSGDRLATDELFPIVYDELRQIAGRLLKDESRAPTLQATSLVNEAYLRLIGPLDVTSPQDKATWQNRAHFFGAAALAIRRILTDHARERNRLKRGGGLGRVPLDDSLSISSEQDVDLVSLDDALTRLATVDEQKARVVSLRFFAGLTVDQTALALGVSPSTVARDWQFARVWLSRDISARRDERSEKP